MSKNENIHAGHRERLINMVYNVGLKDISPIQSMEFILCFVFPRGDVNPLAHRLLEKFKKISHVMDASLNDLVAVKGMGVTSAKKLKSLSYIFDIYALSRTSKNEDIGTYGDIYDYAEVLLRFKHEEQLYIFGFNNRREYVAERCLARGSATQVCIDMREISNFVMSFKVPAVYIAHNHPSGSCLPSQQDIITYYDLYRKLEFCGCRLLDDFIVGDEGIFSMREQRMKRIFGTNEDVDELASILANQENLDINKLIAANN